MLSPNQVKEQVAAIKHWSAPGEKSRKTDTLELYEKVLKEIANGSIDPRSLALEAIVLSTD